MPWLLLAGCMGGPNLETRIFELRVVAAKAEPATVAPGEPFDLELWVADPEARGAEVLTWSCFDDLPCGPVTSPVPEPRDGITPSVVQSRIAAPAPIWFLACTPGDCGDLDNPDPSDLRDPFGWLQRLPLAGVSAASRLPPVAFDPQAPPPVNPVLTVVPDVILDRSALEVALTFEVTDADQAFGYATSGGFDAPAYDVTDGTVELTWLPDAEQDTPGEAFVVFTNASGGTEVWQAEVP